MRMMISWPALLVLAVLSGCNSYVRTVHLVPGAQATDVYLDNKLILKNMCYKDVGCYTKACKGCRNLKFKPIGQDSPSLLDVKIKLESDAYMTLVAMGTDLNCTEGVLYCDDRIVDSYKARIRIIHASPNSPPMDIALIPASRDAGQTETQPADSEYMPFRELCFRDASIYNEFDPGDYTLQSRSVESGEIILNIPVMTFCEGTNYTIFIIGQCEKNSLAAMSVIDAQESWE